MKILVCWVKAGGKTSAALQELTAEYSKRIRAYNSGIELAEFRDEERMLQAADKTAGRLVLLDSRGKQFSSEQFANFIRDNQDSAVSQLAFGIGPHDGFSERTRGSAHLLLSLGAMTLPHELARVVLLEQIYRAYTILKGHPYHLGH